MRKFTCFILFTFYFLLFTLYFLPTRVLAQWIDGNYARYAFFQNGVPHFNKYGKIQTQFNSDSMYLLGLYYVDLGPVTDQNGNPKGQIWNQFAQQLAGLGVSPSNTNYFRNTLPEVKAAGFNTIYPMLPWYRLPNSWEMDELDASGLKTIMPVGVYGLFGANNVMSTQKPASEEPALNGLFVSQYGQVAGSTTSINDGLWHYAAVVFDKTNWHIYLDGVEQRSSALTTNIVKNGQLTIGNRGGNRNNPWKGELDEMHVYNRVLSAQEVQQEFQTCPTLQTECVSKNGLVGLWHFDETSGNVVVDSSVNPQNGTATGTTVVSGKFGNARSFNNNTDRITASDIKLPSGNAEISVTFWLKTSTSLKDEESTMAFDYGSDAAGQSVIIYSTAADFWTLRDLQYKVNLYKNRPTTFLWHLFDENPNPAPDTNPMNEQKWKLVHDTIKGVDPDRAVFANVAGATCWPTSYSDFSMFDDYETFWINNPESGQTERTSALSGLAYLKSTSSTCNKPVIGIYQSFGATNPIPGFALPTAEELKAQYFISLLNGSAGLILFLQQNSSAGGNQIRPWYDFDPNKGNGMNPQVNAHLWNQAAAMNAFVETNNKVFLSPTATDLYNVYFNATEGLARSIRVILKNTNEPNIRYLLAVNTEKARSIMKVSFPGKNITKVTTLTLNRLTDISSTSEFQIDMGGYNGELYKIEFSPFETVTPSQTPTPSPTPTSIPCPMKARGNLDCNNIIDIFDYNILVSNFGNTGAVGWHVADINPNGKIDIFDYNILVSNFGATQ